MTMTIEFHCPKCGKHIKAPKEAAGKNGKCPACHQSVYVPTPDDEIEPLELTPLDDAAERERERLLDEARKLREATWRDNSLPPEGAGGPRLTPQPISAQDMTGLVTKYAIAMAQGKLAEADAFAAQIRKDMRAAENAIQQITVDEILPPGLDKIPRPVLVGFFKQLREGR
jgi:uncharacterized Zn finger protein (UPF0148 family)